MNVSNNKTTQSMKEYDSYNLLDAFVLNLLVEDKKLSIQQIFSRTQKKLPVSELTINSCLLFMYLNGLVDIRHASARKVYKITDNGKEFLKTYGQMKRKILELS